MSEQRVSDEDLALEASWWRQFSPQTVSMEGRAILDLADARARIAALEAERDKYKAFLFDDAHEHAERIKEIAGGPLPLSPDQSWSVWCEALAITHLGVEQQPDWQQWQDDEFAYVCSDCGNGIAPGVTFWSDRANPRHDRCDSCHALAALATTEQDARELVR